MQARVRVATLDAIFARGVRVGRVDRAAGVERGLKIRLVPGGAARIAAAAVGCRRCCRCGLGGCGGRRCGSEPGVVGHGGWAGA